ncbi:MAG: hypothetical protein JZU50_09115 [Desulfobulbaceae bacterium]|nr:hypothetical protein [Desulfobulbaceae bacterium]
MVGSAGASKSSIRRLQTIGIIDDKATGFLFPRRLDRTNGAGFPCRMIFEGTVCAAHKKNLWAENQGQGVWMDQAEKEKIDA